MLHISEGLGVISVLTSTHQLTPSFLRLWPCFTTGVCHIRKTLSDKEDQIRTMLQYCRSVGYRGHGLLQFLSSKDKWKWKPSMLTHSSGITLLCYWKWN